MEKVLRINVGAENGPVATIEELGAYAGLGGIKNSASAIAAKIPVRFPIVREVAK